MAGGGGNPSPAGLIQNLKVSSNVGWKICTDSQKNIPIVVNAANLRLSSQFTLFHCREQMQQSIIIKKHT
jgi:hypothetical protein